MGVVGGGVGGGGMGVGGGGSEHDGVGLRGGGGQVFELKVGWGGQ